MIVSFGDIIFMYDHKCYKAWRALEFVLVSNYFEVTCC